MFSINSKNINNNFRLCALLFPILIGCVFITTSLTQLWRNQNNFVNSSLKKELKFSAILFVIIFLQIFEKFALFLELIKTNFKYEFVIENSNANDFKKILKNYLKVNKLN